VTWWEVRVAQSGGSDRHFTGHNLHDSYWIASRTVAMAFNFLLLHKDKSMGLILSILAYGILFWDLLDGVFSCQMFDRSKLRISTRKKLCFSETKFQYFKYIIDPYHRNQQIGFHTRQPWIDKLTGRGLTELSRRRWNTIKSATLQDLLPVQPNIAVHVVPRGIWPVTEAYVTGFTVHSRLLL
jgi:hypothetical protein